MCRLLADACATERPFKGAGETPAVREALLQLLEDAVERDGIGGDGAGVRARRELGECAGGRALLENFHLVGIHRGAGHEDVIVAGEAVHPGGSVDGRLRGSDERRLREIERVASGGVVAGCGDGAETWTRLPSSQVSMSENVSAMVAPLGSTGIPACAASGYVLGVRRTRKRKNALFDPAGVARSSCVVLLAQAGMPVLLKRRAMISGLLRDAFWPP